MMVRNFLLMGVGAFGVACQPALAQDHAPAPLIGSRAVEVPSGPSYASQIAARRGSQSSGIVNSMTS